MRARIDNRILLWGVLLLLAAGCMGKAPGPRFLIVGGPEPFRYCNRTEDGRLRVTVKNVGLNATPAALVRVQFAGSTGSISTAIPTLAPSATIDIHFSIPSSCFTADCTFQISVIDAANNARIYATAGGRCIG